MASVFYFSDTGLAAWLADIATPDALRNSYLNGSFFENFVIIEEDVLSVVHGGENVNP